MLYSNLNYITLKKKCKQAKKNLKLVKKSEYEELRAKNSYETIL